MKKLIAIAAILSIFISTVLLDTKISRNQEISEAFKERVQTLFIEMHGKEIDSKLEVYLNEVIYPNGFKDKVFSTTVKVDGEDFNVLLHCPINATSIDQCAHMQNNFKNQDISAIVESLIREEVNEVIEKKHIEMLAVRVELEEGVNQTIESEILAKVPVGFRFKSLLLRLHPSYYESKDKDEKKIQEELYNLLSTLSRQGLILTCDLVVMDEQDLKKNDRRIYKYEANMTFEDFSKSGGRFKLGG